MKKIILVLTLFLVWSQPAAGGADLHLEIEHLLDFVEQSGCSFIRNGKTYTPVQARQHITKKYTYLKKRIRTAEQFIAHAASKSSITGEHYSVRCAGEKLSSKAWLEAELKKYRQRRDQTRNTGG